METKDLNKAINKAIHQTGDYLKTVDVENIEKATINNFHKAENKVKSIDFKTIFYDNTERLKKIWLACKNYIHKK
jgi:hypothetical protein